MTTRSKKRKLLRVGNDSIVADAATAEHVERFALLQMRTKHALISGAFHAERSARADASNPSVSIGSVHQDASSWFAPAKKDTSPTGD